MMFHSRLFALVSAALVVSAATISEKRANLATVYSSCKADKVVALTFDDGPYIYSKDIVDQLNAAGAKGTFFYNGNNYDCIYSADVVARVQYAYAQGHMIADHTWAHADLTTLSVTQLQDTMYRVEEAFSRIIGVKPAFMRPPYGSYNDNVRMVAAARNQSVVIWDQDSQDSDGATVAQSKAIYDQAVAAKPKNMLFLNHETYETTADQVLPYAISLLQKNGYKLVTLAECLGLDPYVAIGAPQSRDSSWTCDGTPAPGTGCGGSIPCKSGTPYLAPGGSTPPPTSSSSSTPSTTPTSTPTGKTIRPGKSNAKCLTAASNKDGAVVEIQNCAAGSTKQAWTYTGGALKVFGNKCLDVTNGSTANGNKMQIYTCGSGNPNQQFYVTADARIAWTNKGECLDLTGGSTANNNVVQMWACGDGNANQVWNMV